MSAIKITQNHFTAANKVFGRQPDGLTAILRALATDNVTIALRAAGSLAVVDNSGGLVAGGASGYQPFQMPTVGGDVTTGSGGVAVTEFNTNLGHVEDAGHAFANVINKAAAILGLPVIATPSGVVATPGTIAAIPRSITGHGGAGSVSFASGVASYQAVATNFERLRAAANAVLGAIGAPMLGGALDVTYGPVVPGDLIAVPVAVATAGPNAMYGGDASVVFTRFADNLALLVAAWHDGIGGLAATPLGAVPAPIPGAPTYVAKLS